MSLFFNIFTPFVSCVLNFLCMTYFFKSMSSSQKRKEMSFIGIACFVVFLFSMYFLKAQPLIKLIVMTLLTIVYTFLYNFKFYNRIFISIAYIAICSVGENTIVYASLLLLDINHYRIQEGIGFLIGSVMAKLIGLVMLFFVVVTKKRLFYGSFRLKWLSLYFLPFSSIVACVVMHIILMNYDPNVMVSILGLVSMILLVLSNFLIFSIVDKMQRDIENETKLTLAEELVKNQTLQYEALFNTNREVYKIQHDNKNFLLGVVSEIESGKTDSAMQMLKEQVNVLLNSDNKTLTGNSVADTVLGYKFSVAERWGINIDFEHKNIVSLNISGVDFAILVGNALDNAIEASQKLPRENRYIKVFMIIRNDRLILNVSNNVADEVDTENLKTQKNNTDRHGFGIINMQSIAKKYNGEVLFEYKDKVFSTIISVDNIDA